MTCKVCEKPETEVKLDKHHIISKSKGGSNHPNNLVLLCPNCHRKVHSGDIILEGKCFSTKGMMLVWHKKGEPDVLGEFFKPPEVYIIGENKKEKKEDTLEEIFD